MRRILTPLFRHGDQNFDHPLPLAKGPRNWYTKVADNGAQCLRFEGIPWERVLTGHDSHGGDGGGFRMRLLDRPPATLIPALTHSLIEKQPVSYTISYQFLCVLEDDIGEG